MAASAPFEPGVLVVVGPDDFCVRSEGALDDIYMSELKGPLFLVGVFDALDDFSMVYVLHADHVGFALLRMSSHS